MTTQDAIERFEARQAELKRLISEGDQEILTKFRNLTVVENLDVSFDFNHPNTDPQVRYKPEVITKMRVEVDAYVKRRRDLQLRIMD
jgi:hypothetical protein